MKSKRRSIHDLLDYAVQPGSAPADLASALAGADRNTRRLPGKQDLEDRRAPSSKRSRCMWPNRKAIRANG
jgi:hypothetical protein